MPKRLFYCLLWLAASHPASAGTDDGRHWREFLPALFQSVQQQGLQQQRQTGDDLEGLLADVEKRYGESLAQLRQLNAQMARKQQALDAIGQDILTAQQKLDRENSRLAKQVRAAYQLGQQQPLKLMLNQQAAVPSGLLAGYFQSISHKRMEELSALQKELKVLHQLDALRQAEADNLLQQLQKKQAEQVVLAEFRKQRDKLLGAASKGQRQALDELSEGKVQQLLASLPHDDGQGQQSISAQTGDDVPEIAENYPQLSGPFSAFKGHLSLPVLGGSAQNITSIQSPSFLNGILIRAKEGVDVHAIASGKVVFADWLKGMGLLVIIRHEDHYMSLYAYNDSLYKKKDEAVKAGEVIAAVGKSGGRSQPGLYFEIREDGKPVDPLDWCKH